MIIGATAMTMHFPRHQSSLWSTTVGSKPDISDIARADSVSGSGNALLPAQTSSRADAPSSVSRERITNARNDIYTNTGAALGLSRPDYTSDTAYLFAVKKAFEELKSTEDGPQKIAAMEKQLQLDKLGVSLETVVDSMNEPGGENTEALESALRKQISAQEKNASQDGISRILGPDPIGLYGPSARL